MRSFRNAKASHIFSTKNTSIFQILTFKIFNETLINDVVNFEEPGSDLEPTQLLYFSDPKVVLEEGWVASEVVVVSNIALFIICSDLLVEIVTVFLWLRDGSRSLSPNLGRGGL